MRAASATSHPMRISARGRGVSAVLLGLALGGCAAPTVTATSASADASATGVDGDLAPGLDAPPVRRDVPRVEAPVADAEAPAVADADGGAPAELPTPSDAALTEGPALPRPDDPPGACTDDGQVRWYSRSEAPDARCVMCVCSDLRFQCVERSPDGAPTVTPTEMTGSAPRLSFTWSLVEDGVYELVALWPRDARPREPLPPRREVVEVRHGDGAQTFLAFARRIHGGPVERSLHQASEFPGTPGFYWAQSCPTSGILLPGSLFRVIGPGEGPDFTLYRSENVDGTGPVLAHAYRRVR